MSGDGQWQAPGYGPGRAPGGWPGSPGHGAGPGAYGWGYQAYAPKPGVVPLRPLGVGEVISGVFSTLQRYPAALYLPLLWSVLGSLVVVVACAVAAAVPLGNLLDAARDGRGLTGAEEGELAAVLVGSGLLLVLCMLAMATVATATATVVARHAVVGRRLTARQAWAEARPALGRVLVSQLLIGALTTGIMLLSGAPLVLLSVLTHGSPVAMLGMLLLVPGWLAAMYVQVRLVLDVPVLVLEGAAQRAAIRRAWRLNEGAWWRSFGIPYLVNMLGSVAGQFVIMPFAFAGMFVLTVGLPAGPAADDGPSHLQPGAVVGGMGLVAVGVFLSIALTLPLTPLTNALMYVDRRIRREGLDVGLAAAAGIPGWPPRPAPTGTGPEPIRTTDGQDAHGGADPADEASGSTGAPEAGGEG